MRSILILALAVLLGAGARAGQETATTEAAEPTRAQRTEGTLEQRRDALRERIRRAIRLPRTTDEAREEGASEEEVQEVLRTGRERGVPAGEIQEILEGENQAMRDGRQDNLGSVVQELKASGLRGRELADAIHAEQAARGIGRTNSKKPKKGRDHDDSDFSEESGSRSQSRSLSEESTDRGRGQGNAKDKNPGQGQGKRKDKGKPGGGRP